MPGKKDPEYFPLNPTTMPYVGKFDNGIPLVVEETPTSTTGEDMDVEKLVSSIREKLRMEQVEMACWNDESSSPLNYSSDAEESWTGGNHRRRTTPYGRRKWRRRGLNSLNFSKRGISKENHTSCHLSRKSSSSSNWWGCKSSDPYALLQELISSGTLIKEAVRRINNCSFLSKTIESNGGTAANNITKKFTYVDDDGDSCCPPLPMSAP